MRVSLGNVLIIAATLVLVLAASLLAMRVARWRRDRALRRHPAPILVVPLDDEPIAPARPALREVFAERPALPSPRIPPAATPRASAALKDDDIALDEQAAFARQHTQEIETDPVEGNGSWKLDGSRVRYYRPEDGTLQFLPGRLEIVGGEDLGQEIHFTRPPGEDNATITFGRAGGPPLRHVQLLDPTVSRSHARLVFRSGRWHLNNLSQTNPVMLNGAPLPDHGSGIALEEGDRIEMGAVVFLFHAR